MRSSILFSVAELSQPKMSDRARAADNESLPGGVNDSSYRARNSRAGVGRRIERHLLVSAKRLRLKNDSINPQPQARRSGFLMSGVGTQQGPGGRSIGPK